MENEKELDYIVNSKKYFDKEYINNGTYNGYDVKGHAMADAKEITAKYLNSHESYRIKKKAISTQSKNSKKKNALIATLVALGLAAGTISFVDLAKHPEDYLTTHPDFDGAPTISEIIDRTPENFGIGGR